MSSDNLIIKIEAYSLICTFQKVPKSCPNNSPTLLYKNDDFLAQCKKKNDQISLDINQDI